MFTNHHWAGYITTRRWQLACASSAIVFLGALVYTGQRIHAQDRVLEGSTSILQEVFTKADGSKELTMTYRFATDTDGSTVMTYYRDAASAENPLRIVQLASGFQGYISDAHQQKSLRAVRPASRVGLPQNTRTPASQCMMTSAHETYAATEQVSGYKSAKIVSGGRSSWYSLDHGCALVAERMDWQDGSKSEKHLVMLSPGKPDASLFAVPDTYSDVPASVFTN